uniref:Uncharacterized protein n=1 Tax=Anguilla anguilla TaxID=7936 RepID=A0A0E9QCC5_ANGAN
MNSAFYCRFLLDCVDVYSIMKSVCKRKWV